MQKKVPLLIIFMLIIACTGNKHTKHFNSLMKAYNEKNYFELNNQFASIAFDEKNSELLLCRAKLDHVFNKPEHSNILINKILDSYSTHFNDTIIADLIESKSINNFRLQDYKAAFDDINLLLSNYSHIFDSLKLISLQEDLIFRKAIQGVPKMTVNKKANKDIHIPIERDFAGLLNIPIQNDEDTINFIFDTGANVSVISKSFAKQFNLKLLPDKAIVNSISGKKMDCELGYCDISLNEFEVKNVLFLILEDSLLSFGGGYYVINGIIGFPIINTLKEISLLNDSVLIIPENPRTCNYSNFALYNLEPTILVLYNNDSLPFHFDTGADKTLLFSPFYKKYKKKILENFSTIESSVTGAGGSTYTKVFLIDSLKISVGESGATLDSVELLSEDLLQTHKYVYGNFGQDYMRNFSTVHINFESMCIEFSNFLNQ